MHKIARHRTFTRVASSLGSLLVLAGLSACPSGGDTPANMGGAQVACMPGTARVCQCEGTATSTQLCAADGGSYGACMCEAAAASSALPCAVSKVLQDKCLSCHGATLNNTAPMHLNTQASFHVASPANASVMVDSAVKARIHNMQSPMPPPTMPQLTTDELATLDTWLDSGAPMGDATQCRPTVVDAGMGGSAGTGEPADAGTDAGGAVDGDVECYDFLAHTVGAESPFNVANGTKDLYHCWTFAAPWDGDVQGISFKSKVDDSRIVHHWLLYQNVTAQQAGGSPCLGAHPDAALVAGWAVGGSDTILPNDVGMQMGTTGYTLEIHYNNDTGESIADASGVKVCVTKKPRPHTATTHWLGTTNLSLIGAGDVSSTCTPNYSNGPITILSSWPHMHKHGVHMKSTIMRSGGTQETLIDKPFDFNYQISYPTPMVLNPGDKIATTCTYGSGPVSFGEGTDQEMCFNFVVAWPAGSLASLSGGSFTANQCFQ